MTASIEISAAHDLPGIARAAGQPDDFWLRYADGRLYVEGVTQEDLEAAVAAYDPQLIQRARTAARIAERRYRAEVAGITVDGMYVDTDDRSKLLINGAALEAVIDADYTLEWKTPSGFIPLTAPQVIAVARAVRAHVQACFDREGELLAELAGGTFTEDMIEEGWPNG
ncbi:hypothetical protein FQZ97_563050 [compost metagenome]